MSIGRTSIVRLLRTCLPLGVVALTSCSSSSNGSNATGDDAGWGNDAGATNDADTTNDAGTTSDAGMANDAGAAHDGGKTRGDAGAPPPPPIDPNAFYVAPNGNDGNDGSLAKPFATLEHAQSAMQGS